MIWFIEISDIYYYLTSLRQAYLRFDLTFCLSCSLINKFKEKIVEQLWTSSSHNPLSEVSVSARHFCNWRIIYTDVNKFSVVFLQLNLKTKLRFYILTCYLNLNCLSLSCRLQLTINYPIGNRPNYRSLDQHLVYLHIDKLARL